MSTHTHTRNHYHVQNMYILVQFIEISSTSQISLHAANKLAHMYLLIVVAFFFLLFICD